MIRRRRPTSAAGPGRGPWTRCCGSTTTTSCACSGRSDASRGSSSRASSMLRTCSIWIWMTASGPWGRWCGRGGSTARRTSRTCWTGCSLGQQPRQRATGPRAPCRPRPWRTPLLLRGARPCWSGGTPSDRSTGWTTLRGTPRGPEAPSARLRRLSWASFYDLSRTRGCIPPGSVRSAVFCTRRSRTGTTPSTAPRPWRRCLGTGASRT
ncbi:hypothetical protein DFJ74DRAFT_682871 [Hyaloraphidium curvatum]|nr:hypothetical protein DFJ74DRAFT_682871 [Hyaloraphidium curvatum]